MLGDWWQLPPVLQTPLFVNPFQQNLAAGVCPQCSGGQGNERGERAQERSKGQGGEGTLQAGWVGS